LCGIPLKELGFSDGRIEERPEQLTIRDQISLRVVGFGHG